MQWFFMVGFGLQAFRAEDNWYKWNHPVKVEASRVPSCYLRPKVFLLESRSSRLRIFGWYPWILDLFQVWERGSLLRMRYKQGGKFWISWGMHVSPRTQQWQTHKVFRHGCCPSLQCVSLVSTKVIIAAPCQVLKETLHSTRPKTNRGRDFSISIWSVSQLFVNVLEEQTLRGVGRCSEAPNLLLWRSKTPD